MSGYSSTPLIKKLGIKENDEIVFLNVSDEVIKEINLLPSQTFHTKLINSVNFILFSTTSKEELAKEFEKLRNSIASNGTVWISWPKKSSNIETDLNENIIRDIGLKNGMVDVKVCAINDDWSGLKFVIRLKDRI